MIACISPGMTSADHSVNTLRYSDRLKDHPRVSRSMGEHRLFPDEVVSGEYAERDRHRATLPVALPSHKSESPGPALRRSPSPTTGVIDALGAGGRLSRPRATSVGMLETAKDEQTETTFSAGHDECLNECDDLLQGVTTVAWEDAEPCVACPELPRGSPPAAAVAASGLASGAGSRQHVSRRGRQPTLKPREAGTPARPDALGSRGVGVGPNNGGAVDAERQLSTAWAADLSGSRELVCERSPALVPPPPEQPPPQQPLQVQPLQSQLPPSPQQQLQQQEAGGVAHHAPAEGVPRGHGGKRGLRAGRGLSPERGRTGRAGGDLRQQDDRYLHNTLTSEVFERSGDAGGVLDVGVEDLTDLEHLEALDEVRQWEDRIVSQHMVAVQEDARLLTEESALLSQVQQGASYDIDWYVSEVDKVVRRKMDVYAGFLEDLEVFKAQLRREETLSRNWQRARDPATSSWAPAGVGGAGADLDDCGCAGLQAQFGSHEAGSAETGQQRVPRTPRPPASGPASGVMSSTTGGRTPDGSHHRADAELSAHAAALEEANALLRAEADRAHRRVTALEEEARVTAAAKDAQIASLEERIEATSQILDGTGSEKCRQPGGLAVVPRVWRCPSLPF